MSIRILICVLVLGAAACDSSPQSEQRPQSAEISAAQPQTENTERAQTADSSNVNTSKAVKVLFFGTSLTAGYGLDPSLAFPNLIEKKSAETSTPIVAINAGLSGETSAGAVRRIDWALKSPVDIVVLETGGNDALRALDPDSLEANLTAAVTRIRALQPKAKILLVVMEAPPNLGQRYTARFRKAYVDVAAKEKLTLVPFLLDKVAGKPELNQADGVHPNEKGEPIVADNVWKSLQPVVREVYRARASG
jgi:acyl-CoA thioesterase-1